MNRSYYYKKIIEKSEELANLVWDTVRFRRRVCKLSDIKDKSDEDLLYLYGNLKLAIKEQLHICDEEEA